MFSDQWKMLAEIVERGKYATPNRYLSPLQSLQLLYVFLLQPKESDGVAYIVQSGISLIKLKSGQFNNSLHEQAGLNLHFNTEDENLMTTGQFLLLKTLVDAWLAAIPSLLSPNNLLHAHAKPQDLQTRLRL